MHKDTVKADIIKNPSGAVTVFELGFFFLPQTIISGNTETGWKPVRSLGPELASFVPGVVT